MPAIGWGEDTDGVPYAALYDYSPSQESGEDPASNVLSFKAGSHVRVFGSEQDDGFVKAEINGKIGLVPLVFLHKTEDPVKKMSVYQTSPNVATGSPASKASQPFKQVGIYTYYVCPHLPLNCQYSFVSEDGRLVQL